MKIKIFIILFLIYPYLNHFLRIWIESYSLIFLFIDVVYYSPISLFFYNDNFFFDTEIGVLPNVYGRLLTTLVYAIAIFMVCKLLKWRIRKGSGEQ